MRGDFILENILENIWTKKFVDEEISRSLQEETGLPQTFVNIMVANGMHTVEEIKNYLNPTFKQLHNPLLMSDMEKAVERINRAIDNGERILFYGDYDADGVTTTTVAVKGFEHLGVKIDYFVPNRFKEGYGLHPRKMEQFAQEYDLIITGDTGIRAFEGVQKVKESGHADIIITDHHEPFIKKIEFLHEAPKYSVIEEFGDEYIALPDAYAVIDPHRLGDKHPCKTHAGVGVIFKTMLAVYRSRNQPVQPLLDMLDLVATGTIADLARQVDSHGEMLDFEVRVLCKAGLQMMNEKPSLWVYALCEKIGLNPEATITGETIGFGFGPMLNAVGRLHDPMPAMEFLLEEDVDASLEKAEILKGYNQERKKSKEVAANLIKKMEDEGDTLQYDYGIVVHSDLYGEGVAGLVAGAFCEHFYRPAIALTTAEVDGVTMYKGSARSIEDVHVLEALYEVQREIGEFVFGGHTQAAGLRILPEQFEAFQKAFRKACMKQETDEDTFTKKFYYQTEAKVEEVDFNFLDSLSQLEPFGEGNTKPTFLLSRAEVVSIKPHGNGRGFNMVLKQERDTIDATSFDLAPTFLPLYQEALAMNNEVFVDVLFQPSKNEWKGRVKIQLHIQDLKIVQENE